MQQGQVQVQRQFRVVTEGADQIGTFNLTPHSYRKWCKACGGHLFTEHPGMGMTDVYAAILPGLAFKPVFHVQYAETVLPLHDGLPKFRDMPKEVGGSGETMPERATVETRVTPGRALSAGRVCTAAWR